LQTRHDVIRIARNAGRLPVKGPGQNFLIDGNIARIVTGHGELSAEDFVWEVGTGTGILTELLAEKCAHVFSVDIDGKLQDAARKELKSFPNITFINIDILDSKHKLSAEVLTRIREFLSSKPELTLKIISNLPYNIATPFILNALKEDILIERMIVMVQREIAERIASAPARSSYGALSVMAQTLADVEIIHLMSRNVFWPRPKIESAVLKITPKSGEKLAQIDISGLKSLMHTLFGQRRKKVLGVVRKNLGEDAFAHFRQYFIKNDINLNARPQDIATVDFIALSKYNK